MVNLRQHTNVTHCYIVLFPCGPPTEPSGLCDPPKRSPKASGLFNRGCAYGGGHPEALSEVIYADSAGINPARPVPGIPVN